MEILNLILDTYAQFFDLQMWIDLFTNPVAWGLIGTLVVMEGLLSADNAIALAVQVKHLPEKQRKKALIYGLWGAYFFRFIAIGIGTALVKLWLIKLIGGLYLLWMAVKFFMEKHLSTKAVIYGAYFFQFFAVGICTVFVKLWWIKLIGGLYLLWIVFKFYKELFAKRSKGETEEEEVHENHKLDGLSRYIGIFWATVVSVELLDIAFSVDSVFAAFGVSDNVGILLLGGMLGILMMRGVAQVFTKLMEKVPELEYTAYILIAFIGFKMLLTLVDVHIGHLPFFAFVVLAIGGTFVVNKINRKKHQQD